ncbi:MAG: sulfatase [Planctomycetota bacterium]|jgi:arylsulfatase A-like enzyme
MPRFHPALFALAGRLVLAAACCASIGCSNERPPLVTDRVHDLVALLDRADVAEGSPYLRVRQASIDRDEDRDGIAYLRTPAGQPLTFRGLPVGGRAVLRFACGTTRPRGDAGAEAPLRLLVEARIHAPDETEEAAFVTLFEERIDPGALAAETTGSPREIELPGAGVRSLDLRLSARPVAGETEGAKDWPAWFSPQIRSDGLEVPDEQAHVSVREVVFDPIERLADAEILAQPADDPVRRSMIDPAAGLGMGGGNRPVLRASASTRVRYRLTPEAGCALEWAVGIASWQGWKRGGDGMTFAVEIDGSRVWERRLDAARVLKDRGWHAGRLDLAPWVGRELALDLVTESGPDAAFDIGGWSDIVVARPHAVPVRGIAEGPSVVLIVVDTLRADRLGAFGGPPDLTPRMDALARQSRVYLAARSASSWTWPATSSILTGLYPNAHGVQDDEHCLLVESLDTLPELFARAGYETGAFVANPLIATENNFHQGFGTFACTPSVTARALNDRLEAWLENTAGRARFAYLHYLDPHQPYRPPPAFAPPEEDEDHVAALEQALAEQLRGGRPPEAADPALLQRWLDLSRRAYDAEIAYFDTAFGELLELLDRHGVLDDALLLLTSDHGEEFVDHGYWAHGPQLYEETVRVPLLVAGFGRSALPPARVTVPVETRDILPTLVGHLGLPDPAYALAGRSLLDPTPGPVFSQTLHGLEEGVIGFTEKRSMATDRWKLIHTPASARVELYDLVADPLEQHDRSAAEPLVRDAMLAELDRWAKVTSTRTPDNLMKENAEATARLKALGYIGR